MIDSNNRVSTAAIILAAGSSTRMGTAKQLLPLQGRLMLEHVIQNVLTGDFHEIIAVIGNEASKIQSSISTSDPRFRWVNNHDYLLGQSTSVKKGINSLRERHAGIMFFLGDLPFIKSSTIQSVEQLGKERLLQIKENFVLQPQYKGKPGHPVFFGNMDTSLFMQLEGDQGARPIMNQVEHRFLHHAEDQGILLDIDTPESYEAAEKSEY